MSERDTNVVVDALVAEYGRVRSRWEGATKRLEFSQRQQVIETELLVTYSSEMELLGRAIVAYGGAIPEVDAITAQVPPS